MATNYLCPVCNIPLPLEDMINGSIASFCPHDKCPSRAAAGNATNDANTKLAIETLNKALVTLAMAKKKLKQAQWALIVAAIVLGWAMANLVYSHLK